MEISRRKQLLEEYKNRRPEMGVFSYKCKITGESFLGTSKDTKSAFNSTNVRLEANQHPNKQLQELWNQYGQAEFEMSVIKVLKYEDPTENHTNELEELREQCLLDDPKAMKIWK